MSRGLERVMVGILEAVAAGPLDTFALAGQLGVSQESIRRALRTLLAAGWVSSLGSTFEGPRKWCSSKQYNLLCSPWARWAGTMGEALGLSAGWLKRLAASAL